MKPAIIRETNPATVLRIILLQNSAGTDVERNLAGIERRFRCAPKCDLIALPEVFAIRGNDADYRAVAEHLPGPITKRLMALAARARAWVLVGSVIERCRGKIYNTSVLINRQGRIVARYRKIHLFEANLDNGQIVRESDIYSAGNKPVMAKVEGWSCGLAICYDLRFPELFRYYSRHGVALFFVPSNFTQKTGKDHWETLIRARAIENQAFVVAPNQCGVNPCTGITSHGHSLVVGPWGDVLATAGDKETILTVTLQPEELRRTRARIPVLRHRRLD
ncbi:MAG: carbon-nitrogen hydrolase family protein [Verrucomicrobia bacterium]|nr:carbon-nitrogen hydrolase family protein [Verrucomicrobiota bacterium]MBU1735649.1 carbon-nitrogen hydrolase family protein [Verrucomicrobiota bacterium]MBU1856687.1 carbon-nitrogen hydrolase family protein [Verrucomicrobiota bacterium]